jgi:HD-like signal output (HDOD) protein
MTTLPVPSAAATLALLWERVRMQGDMPGFAKAIGAILGAMRGEDEQEFCMTQTVLSDPVLTQKVLRLANSGMYAAFGQRINTVSKAVLVLGPDAIGHLALGLKLVEELQDSSQASGNAAAEMEKAVLAGMVAQQVAGSAEGRDSEEAVVCAMLHALGRMAVTFYLPERWSALQDAGGPGGEDGVAPALLGLSLEDVGRATAERWGLPHTLIESMRRVEPAPRPDAFSDADWLAALSTMSSRCADSLWNDDAAGDDTLQELADGFAPMLGVQAGSVMDAIGKARENAIADLSVAPFARAAQQRSGSPEMRTRIRARDDLLLASGIADMRDVAASARPDQMLSMALETIFQGLGFARTVAFLRAPDASSYRARIGFGPGVRALLPRLSFEARYHSDAFHAALRHDRVVFIENAHDPEFAARLPAWWKVSLGSARSFVVIPLCAGGDTLGLLYGDWNDEMYQMPLNRSQFAHLNELRALVVSVLARRQLAEAGAASQS